MFLSQVLSQDHSCRAAVARLITHRLARGQSSRSAETSAYCQATRRLPEEFFADVVRKVGRTLVPGAPVCSLTRLAKQPPAGVATRQYAAQPRRPRCASGSRAVRPGESLAASTGRRQNDTRVLIGLGSGSRVDAIRVRWSDGSLEQWNDVATNRYTTLYRGSGINVAGAE